jgi:hypothetical protein
VTGTVSPGHTLFTPALTVTVSSFGWGGGGGGGGGAGGGGTSFLPNLKSSRVLRPHAMRIGANLKAIIDRIFHATAENERGPAAALQPGRIQERVLLAFDFSQARGPKILSVR